MNDLEVLLDNGGQHGMTKEQLNVIERRIPAELIKERDAGFGKKLSYISGSTVIKLLNEAFGYQWSFRVLEMRVVESVDKVVKDKRTGNETRYPQPPYIQVLGQLIIPQLGIIKEQYGSKALIGGESEQEGAAKAAATDAMKKCATLVGIGLELYDTDESADPAPAPRQQGSVPPTIPRPANLEWDPNEIAKLKEYKAVLGLTDNTQLDPYVREFLDSGKGSFKDITPSNIKAFNVFMKKKAEEV